MSRPSNFPRLVEITRELLAESPDSTRFQVADALQVDLATATDVLAFIKQEDADARASLLAILTDDAMESESFRRALSDAPLIILEAAKASAAAKDQQIRLQALTQEIDRRFQLPIQPEATPAPEEPPAAEPQPLEIIPPVVLEARPVKLEVISGQLSEEQYSSMGRFLAGEWKEVASLTRRSVRFGAYLLQVQAHLDEIDSTRGVKQAIEDQNVSKNDISKNSATLAKRRGPKNKDTGLKAWLSNYASEIPEASAYRYMNMTLAAMEQFKIPTAAAKTLGFPGFVTSAPEELPEKWRSKQTELFEFLDGTSARALLDIFKPRAAKGGAQKKSEDDSDLTEEEIAIQTAKTLFLPLQTSLGKASTMHKASLIHLPLITEAPLEEPGLQTILDHLRSLAALVEEAIEIKKTALR